MKKHQAIQEGYMRIGEIASKVVITLILVFSLSACANGFDTHDTSGGSSTFDSTDNYSTQNSRTDEHQDQSEPEPEPQALQAQPLIYELTYLLPDDIAEYINMTLNVLQAGAVRINVEHILGLPQRVARVTDGEYVYRHLVIADPDYMTDIISDDIDIEAMQGGKVRLVVFARYTTPDVLTSFVVYYSMSNGAVYEIRHLGDTYIQPGFDGNLIRHSRIREAVLDMFPRTYFAGDDFPIPQFEGENIEGYWHFTQDSVVASFTWRGYHVELEGIHGVDGFEIYFRSETHGLERANALALLKILVNFESALENAENNKDFILKNNCMEGTSACSPELLDIQQFLGRKFHEVSRLFGLPLNDKDVVNAWQYVASVWFDTGIFVRVNNTDEAPQIVVDLFISFKEAGSERFHYAGISGASTRIDVRAAFGEPDASNLYPPYDHGGLFNYGYQTECGNFVWFNFDFDSENVISIQYVMDREQHFR